MNKKMETAFTKQQIAESERYKSCRDLILALLEDGGAYSLREVDAILEKYRKGKVK